MWDRQPDRWIAALLSGITDVIYEILQHSNIFRRLLTTVVQVVTLAVYIYLIASVIGRRNLQTGFVGDFDIFPVLTFMEYFFYMGWLKVDLRVEYNVLRLCRKSLPGSKLRVHLSVCTIF